MTFHLKTYPDALRQLFVAASVQETNDVFDKAIALLQKNFSLPGYRKGKVPVDIIAKTNPPELTKYVSDLFMDQAIEYIESQNQMLYGNPRFNPMSGLSKDKEFIFSIVYEVYPTPKSSPKFEGQEFEVEECVIDKSFVEETLCRQIGLTESSKVKIKETDLVHVEVLNEDYKGDKKEAAFDPSKLEKLLGKKTGDTVELSFDDLSGYLPEFLGKVSDPISFKITDVSAPKAWDSVTDTEISEKTPFKTKNEYKEHVDNQLKGIAEAYNNSQKAMALTTALGAQIDIELPKSLWLNNTQELALKIAEQEVVRSEVALNDIPNHPEIVEKFTNMPLESKNGLAFVIWLDSVAKEQKINVDNNEMEYHLYRYAQQNRMPVNDFKKKLRAEDKENIRMEIIREKSMSYVISQVKFKTKTTISIAEVLKKDHR